MDKLEEAISVTKNEYELMTQKPVSGKELKLAQEYLKGRLALSLEDSQDVAETFGESLLLEGKLRTVKEMIEGVEKVNPEEIQKLARQIFKPSQLNLTIVGKVKKKSYI
ncbi:MAG: hypothetical protein NTZ93_00230 [Candidatus Beckwithbacteria bacterium]|nr:hypothetical protein [Candidatus Beckwithbacteria bacterium]